jgi:nucleoside-diphosphate-sugar epimerase
MKMKRVLLTGAAGRIGTAFRQLTDHQYAFRLVDRQGAQIANPGGHETVTADLAELAVCQRVCQGIDLVVHLAADPSPRADFYDSLLDNNIKAAYNILRAAKDQGCQRVIFASSIQAIEGYPLDTQVHPEMPSKPMNMYAATKLFGEAMCHYFAYAEGLSCIAIRVGAYGGNRNYEAHPEEVDGRTLSAYVSPRDLTHLIVQCLEAPDLPYAVFQAVSDNRFKRMDISSARQLVNYQPQDDAFELFKTGIQNRERWYEEWGRGQR